MKKLDLTQAEYRAYPAISTSDIKQILDNPYKFKIGMETEETPAMALGSLFHTMVLEPDELLKRYVVAPSVDKRTKEGKEIWADFLKNNESKNIVDSVTYKTAFNALNSLKVSGVFDKYFTQGEAESSYIGELFGREFKVRPDYYIKEKGLIVDLKFVTNASQSSFQRLCANLKYYIQAYLYTKITGAKNFIFVAVETKEPYTIGIYELNYLALELGESQVEKALEILENVENVENVYNSVINKLEPTTITLPNYAFYDSEI